MAHMLLFSFYSKSHLFPFPIQNYLRKTSKQTTEKRSSLYTSPNGDELPKYVIQELTQFTRKRSKALIDVYWLYDDGMIGFNPLAI